MEDLVKGSIWARNQPRRKPGLTRDAIVHAAIAIADEEGLEAVSMRRVAAALEARTMSLYSHFDSKDDLLELIADELAGEALLTEEELGLGWREGISEIARRSRTAIQRHPWRSAMVSHRSRIGPNALRHLEQSLAVLDELHLDLPQALAIIRAVDHYMLGYVAMEAKVEQSRVALLDREYLREIAESGEYPRLGPLLLDPDKAKMLGDFETGLRWLLDGIEMQLSGPKGT